jgi:hypothetical protein
MLYIVLLVLCGLLAYVRASRKARERRPYILAGRQYMPRRERDCWFV